MNENLERLKFESILVRKGKPYEFNREEKDTFGESTGKEIHVDTVLGIYHESTSYIAKTIGETTKYVSKISPMILCRWNDIENLEKEDIVIIDNNKFKINRIINVSMLNIYADVSLEDLDVEV